MRILLVEDDDLIGSGLETGLRNASFAVDWAKNGQHAKLALSTTRYDMVVLDLGLPGLSGTSLLEHLRAQGNPVPILVLTAKDTTEDRIAGLDAGADDYVGKPFDLGEVISRCRALMRRSQSRASEVLVWRDLTVNPATMTASRGEVPLQLNTREFGILVHLLVHAGEPQRKAKIEESIYGWDEEVESNAIEVHVSTLRKKIGADTIRTIRGVGYVIEKP
ncbi:transcriptional regulator [Caballeronia temeraria]|uniref:Transcriptional regulator n=1 Tax=Caballeronia temeraria TaxID=1777137 RepID=A0A158CVQ4_9BURK|nr:response regulator transcription factor [Caballeronia temeraria]SAK86006.1 transcriptional regulator [Caballeronia temeraria]